VRSLGEYERGNNNPGVEGFVVHWHDMGATYQDEHLTFQLRLNSGGAIAFLYKTMDQLLNVNNGPTWAEVTIGVQNEDGTRGVTVWETARLGRHRHNTRFAVNNKAVLLYPQ
jgi:hypothetical protein